MALWVAVEDSVTVCVPDREEEPVFEGDGEDVWDRVRVPLRVVVWVVVGEAVAVVALEVVGVRVRVGVRLLLEDPPGRMAGNFCW